jgi:uncharacterized repeat protein (TIGR03803 family)
MHQGLRPLARDVFSLRAAAVRMAAVAAVMCVGLVQPAAAAGAKLTVLHSFNTTDNFGYGPTGGLVFGADGTLYGTTASGSTFNGGTLFSLKPPARPKGKWASRILHIFGGSGDDGTSPEGGLYMDADGAIYGTTVFGPPLVYKIAPPATPKGSWVESFLHVYNCCEDAVSPYDGLIVDTAGAAGTVGALYGTSSRGGSNSQFCFGGCGTIYRLIPPKAGHDNWPIEILYDFEGGSNAWNPTFGLVMDDKGVLYGVTGNGGSDNEGVVFSLTPPAKRGQKWRYRALHNFQNGDDGALPVGRLMLVGGDLYGITGAAGGTVFKMTRPPAGKLNWKLTTLYRFSESSDGSQPNNQLLPGPNGSFYGTTFAGGSKSCGTVYQLKPPKHGNAWTKATLHDFQDQPSEGCSPGNFSLITDSTGALFGATSSGGAGNAGTIYKLVP